MTPLNFNTRAARMGRLAYQWRVRSNLRRQAKIGGHNAVIAPRATARQADTNKAEPSILHAGLISNGGQSC